MRITGILVRDAKQAAIEANFPSVNLFLQWVAATMGGDVIEISTEEGDDLHGAGYFMVAE